MENPTATPFLTGKDIEEVLKVTVLRGAMDQEADVISALSQAQPADHVLGTTPQPLRDPKTTQNIPEPQRNCETFTELSCKMFNITWGYM